MPAALQCALTGLPVRYVCEGKEGGIVGGGVECERGMDARGMDGVSTLCSFLRSQTETPRAAKR